MSGLIVEPKRRDRRKLVCEDLSPILKENLHQNRLRIRSRDSSDETTDLTSRLKSVEIDTEKEIGQENMKDDVKNKNINYVKKTSQFPKRNQERSQKENRTSNAISAVQKLDEPKINRTRATKKKDSFIVSDSSSISNDSMTIYHRLHSERIRSDVRKITPRSRYRRSISTNDDGIFTPYVIGKRSCSESNSSDDENGNIYTSLKSPKTLVCSPMFPNPRLKDRTNALSNISCHEKDANLKNDSSDLFSTSKPKKKNLPSLKPDCPPSISRNLLKDYSWIFSDDDSSGNEEKESVSSKILNPDIKPATTLDVKLPSTNQNSEKVVVTPTPVTFRLKQVKNLTPKLDAYKKDEPLSFLKSLSTFSSPRILHPDAEQYRKKFRKLKGELALKLFKIFNESVFNNQLPSDLKIEWSARLRSSSGLCYNKRIKNVVGSNNECLRASRIALSTKIIETPDRLRDTLIHEMCHAAAWIIDNKCDGHGFHWKNWAAKAMKAFPELPLIRRCHDYSVNTKFKYKCVKCGYTIGRHSKSLNLERKRCGYCYGQFELILTNGKIAKSNLNRTNMSPKNTNARPLSKFALFVKDNYGKLKVEKPNLKHGEIMKELGRHFASTKRSD